MNVVALYRKLTTDDIVNGPPLRSRIVYTVLLLLLYRVLADIPILHTDEKKLEALLADNPLVGLVDLFAGGDILKHFSIVAAGIFPYVIALAIAMVATWVVPSLRRLVRQGDDVAKKRIERYTLWLSVALAFLFAWAISRYFARPTGVFPRGIRWFTSATFFPSLWIACLVTVGTLISRGISRVISTQGIGKGESVVLAAGSSLVFVKQATHIVGQSHTGADLQRLGIAALIGVATVVLTIYLVRGVRKVSIAIPRVNTSRRSFGTYQPHIPLLIDSGRGVPIAAATGMLALLQFTDYLLPTYAGGSFASVGRVLVAWATPTNIWYWIALATMIVLFTYIANFSVLWMADNKPAIVDQLRQSGAFIPGVRPGNETQQYLSSVTARITPLGALGLVLIAAGLPYLILRITDLDVTVAVVSLIILVKTLDDVGARVDAFRSMESYDGLIRKRTKRL